MQQYPQKPDHPRKLTNDTSNLILNDLKNLTTALKPLSKQLYEKNNALANKLLIINDDGLMAFMEDLVFHLFMVSQLKNIGANCVLNLVGKVVTLGNLFVERGFVGKEGHLKKADLDFGKTKSQNQPEQEKPYKNKVNLAEQTTSLGPTLATIVDILTFLTNRKEAEHTELRIIQTAFSLINRAFLKFMDYYLIIKIYSVCFSCCLCPNHPIVQNISVSAVSSLTEMVFGYGFGAELDGGTIQERMDSQLQILNDFLSYEISNSKYSWMSDAGLKGVVWDLIIIAVKNMPNSMLEAISQRQTSYKSIERSLQTMYLLSADNSFSKASISHHQFVTNIKKSVFDSTSSSVVIDQMNPNNSLLKNSVSFNFRKGGLSDFLRFYKAFIYFSIHLWMNPITNSIRPLVPFPGYLTEVTFFKAIDSQESRNVKAYLYLEGIYLLVTSKNDLALIEEKGYHLIEILAKISQELCLTLCNSDEQIDVKWWDSSERLLDKTCGDLGNVSDSDFVRLIRSTLIALRKRFRGEERSQESIWQEKIENRILGDSIIGDTSLSFSSKLSDNSLNSPIQFGSSENMKMIPIDQKQEKVLKIRWEKLIKNIIRSIRYLSSLNYKPTVESSMVNTSHSIYGPGNQEQPSRKLLLQLQHWFLVCPTFRARNLILNQLLVTSTFLETKAQSVKSSQCVQIGTNLIYGYYPKIDSTGVAILLKMVSGACVDFEDGKGFQEMQEVARMARHLFNQHKETVIENQKVFSRTLQAFVQCVSGLLAEIIDDPKQYVTGPNAMNMQMETQRRNSRFFKMIDFLIEKFTVVIHRYGKYIGQKDWTFITAFFITLCSNRNQSVQLKGIRQLGEIVKYFLKENDTDKQNPRQEEINQEEILNIYVELSKCRIQRVVQEEILMQLKDNLLLIKSQEALMKGFQFIRILHERAIGDKGIIADAQEIEEILIKDCLFRITKLQFLSSILDDFGHLSTDKNLQYNLITLLWSIADHFKNLYPIIQQNQEKAKEQYLKLWKLLFDRLLKLSFKSKQPEFRQSALHAVTQIIAENISILGTDLIIQIMNEDYLSMFCILLDIPRTPIDNVPRVDMTKLGVKNYVKIIKKLIIDKVYIGASECIADQVNERIYQLLISEEQKPQNTGDKKEGTLTVEYLFELCVLIQQILEEPIGFKFINEKQLLLVFREIGERMKLLNEKDIIFRRRLAPLYEELKVKLEGQKSQTAQEENLQETQKLQQKIGKVSEN